MQFPPPNTAPAGWYPNPLGAGVRYWDGRSWAAPAGAELAPRRPDHASLPLPAGLGALAVLLASLLIGRVVVEQLVSLDWPVVTYVVMLVVMGYGPSVLWCLYVSRRWGSGRLTDDLGIRFRWSDAGWGPLTWLAAILVQVMLVALVLLLDVPLSSNVDATSDLQVDRAYLIASGIAAVVAAPIVEEMIFRGVVMRGFLQRMGPTLAVLLQGALFGLAHIDPAFGWGNLGLALVLSGVGVAFGVAAYLLRRIGVSMIAHAIFNAVVLTLVLLGVNDRAREELRSGVVVRADVELQVVDQPYVAEPDRDHDREFVGAERRLDHRHQ